MYTQCYKSKDDLIQNEDLFECSGCKQQLNFFCAGFSETNYKKMSRNTELSFQCNEYQSDNSKIRPPKTNSSKIVNGL